MSNNCYTLLRSLCICIVLLAGCKNTDTQKSKTLQESISFLTANPQLDNRTILVIPLNGCAACITESINFLKSNTEGHCEFVISDKSFKKIKFKVGKLINHKNVVIDTASIFISQQVVYNAPEIFYCKNGKIENAIRLTPQNIDNELMKLRESILVMH